MQSCPEGKYCNDVAGIKMCTHDEPSTRLDIFRLGWWPGSRRDGFLTDLWVKVKETESIKFSSSFTIWFPAEFRLPLHSF